MSEKHIISVNEEVMGCLAECFGASAGMLAGLAGAYLSVDWFGAVTKEITAVRLSVRSLCSQFSARNGRHVVDRPDLAMGM